MKLGQEFELELQRDIYRESYYEFFKDAFKVLNPTDDYSDNWHIEYLCDRLQQETIRIKNKEPRQKDLIINIPFRSAKSLICTVCYPVWSWIIYPEMKFICTSFSGDLALEHAQLSRNLMESMWFQKYFGNQVKLRKDENSKGFFVNESGGFRKSVGIGGQITGSGASCIILDDPNSPKKAESEVERLAANNFYDQTLYSRLNQPEIGVRIIIQQRLHEEDISGHLLDLRPEDHELICIPGELADNISPKEIEKYYIDGLFWPGRFSQNQLRAYKKALGSYGYSGQISQKPTPEGGGIIKRTWLEIVDPMSIIRNPVDEPIHFFADTAYSEKSAKNNDPSAILACFKRKNTLYVINSHEIWLEFPDLINHIIKYTAANGYSAGSKIYIEGAASGKSIIQELRSKTNLNVIEVDKPKDDKLTRLNAVSATVESMRVKLIKGAWNEQFLHQVINQPNSKYWDQTDCFVMAIDNLLNGSDFDFLLM